MLVEGDEKLWLDSEGEECIRGIGIKAGMTIVDAGCCQGNYTIPIAKVVGNGGKVYAIDLEQEPLDILTQRAMHYRIENISPVKNEIVGIDSVLGQEMADVILMYDMLHGCEPEVRVKLYKTIWRLLKKDGVFSVYPVHTRDDVPSWHFENLSVDDVATEIVQEGFRHIASPEVSVIHQHMISKKAVLSFSRAK